MVQLYHVTNVKQRMLAISLHKFESYHKLPSICAAAAADARYELSDGGRLWIWRHSATDLCASKSYVIDRAWLCVFAVGASRTIAAGQSIIHSNRSDIEAQNSNGLYVPCIWRQRDRRQQVSCKLRRDTLQHQLRWRPLQPRSSHLVAMMLRLRTVCINYS